MSSDAAHGARGLRMSLGAGMVVRHLRISLGVRACRPRSAYVAGRPAWSSGAAHVVRRLRISLGVGARCAASTPIARLPRTLAGTRHVARRARVARACAYRSVPAFFPRCLWTILLPPASRSPSGGVSSGRAGHLWMPRAPPTPPPDPRRATRRAPEPAQVVPGPGQGRGGVSRPACAVTRAAVPPPPCPGWSPRRRGSAGTRRCAGGATHGRPHA